MLFESPQARILLALALPVIILTQRMKFSMITLITQLLLYLALAYNADCLVSGRCKLWAWLAVLLPLINTVGYLFFVDKLALKTPVQLPIPRGAKDDKSAPPAFVPKPTPFLLPLTPTPTN